MGSPPWPVLEASPKRGEDVHPGIHIGASNSTPMNSRDTVCLGSESCEERTSGSYRLIGARSDAGNLWWRGWRADQDSFHCFGLLVLGKVGDGFRSGNGGGPLTPPKWTHANLLSYPVLLWLANNSIGESAGAKWVPSASTPSLPRRAGRSPQSCYNQSDLARKIKLIRKGRAKGDAWSVRAVTSPAARHSQTLEMEGNFPSEFRGC